MDICVLGSGSAGNSTYIASGGTKVLIDAGFSCAEIEKRLNEIGTSLSDITAICITHEHSDHKRGLAVICRRHGITVYANHGTAEALELDDRIRDVTWNIFTTGQQFKIGDITFEPFSVPHDSYDPVGFIASSAGTNVGVVTDMGMVTSLVRERLKGCHAVVVESNHDERMLKESERPWPLKQRILGRQGHLSNAQAAELLTQIAGPSLKFVFLAHLSSECNDAETALIEVGRAFAEKGIKNVTVKPALQSRISDLVRL